MGLVWMVSLEHALGGKKDYLYLVVRSYDCASWVARLNWKKFTSVAAENGGKVHVSAWKMNRTEQIRVFPPHTVFYTAYRIP